MPGSTITGLIQDSDIVVLVIFSLTLIKLLFWNKMKVGRNVKANLFLILRCKNAFNPEKSLPKFVYLLHCVGELHKK